MDRELEILKITVAQPFGGLVILREINGEGMLAIQVSSQDFKNVVAAEQKKEPDSPLIHDTLLRIANIGRIEIEYVIISDLRFGAYFAEIAVSRNGEIMKIDDVRPSDAIILALRAQRPIFATEEVLELTRARSHKELENYQLHWLADIHTPTVH